MKLVVAFFVSLKETDAIMRIVMQFGDQLVDALPIPPQWEKDTDYILYLRQELLERNAELIEQSIQAPRFYIEKGFTPLPNVSTLLTFFHKPSQN